MAQTLESYLIALGFSIDQPGLAKLNAALEGTAKLVRKTTGGDGIMGDLLKLQFTFTGVFAGIAGAYIGLADKMASGNQTMRLGAMHALMGQEAFTKLDRSLKLLGVTMDDLWDPKVRGEFQQLWDDQGKMYKGATKFGDALEDVRFQWIRLQDEMEMGAMVVVNDALAQLGFGTGDLTQKFTNLNDYIVDHMPEIAMAISKDLVPALKESWVIMKDVGEVAKDGVGVFQTLIGLLSGDSSLEGTAVSFHSIATAIEHVVSGIDHFLNGMMSAEKVAVHFTAAMGDVVAGKFGAAKGELMAGLGSLTPDTAGLAGGVGGRMAGKAVGSMAGEAIVGTLGAELGPLDVPLTAAGGWIGGKAGGAIGAMLGAKGGYALGSNLPSFELPKGLGSLDSLTTSLKLPPGLLDAIVWNESRGHQFDKNGNVLKSSAGALGIAQLMPSVAKSLGVDPTDEKDNLRGAAMLLEQLNKHYKGNEAEMLAAYNWGMGNVDKEMLRNHGQFRISELPEETRNYVRNAEAFRGNSVANDGAITVNVGGITVAGTNLTHDQVASAVTDGISKAAGKRDFTSTAMSAGYAQ